MIFSRTLAIICIASLTTPTTGDCFDSTVKFRIKGFSKRDRPGEPRSLKDCDWVNQENKKEKRCKKKKYQILCPVSCGREEEFCEVDSEEQFLVSIEKKDDYGKVKKGTFLKTCKWVGVKNTKQRCEKEGEGVAKTCRKTCKAFHHIHAESS